MTQQQNLSNPKNLVSQEFIAFAVEKEVLRFGEFKTKAGRLSPYFLMQACLMMGLA